jgi:hypothetical protein
MVCGVAATPPSPEMAGNFDCDEASQPPFRHLFYRATLSQISENGPVEFGDVDISSVGNVTLAVHAIKGGCQPMNLRCIELKPVGPNP